MRSNNIYISFWKYFFLSGIIFFTFLKGTELYAIPNFPNQYQLKKIQEIAPEHLEMEKTMLGYLKMASHTLNTYKCGIILDE